MNSSGTRTFVGLVVVCSALWAAPAFGQADADLVQRIDRQLREVERQYTLQASPVLSIGERAMLDYGAQFTYSFLAVDDLDQSTRILRRSDGQAYGYLNLDGVHEFYGRLRFTYDDYNPGESFDGGGDQFGYPIGDRYWYRFDYRRAVEAYHGEISKNNFSLQVGRQYVDWGAGISLSEQLYAARMTVEFGSDVVIQGLIGSTPESSVVDFDSSRPSFDGETNRFFAGGMIQWVGWQNHQPYFYVLRQWDNNEEDFATITLVDPLMYDTKFHYESTYWAVGSEGRITPRLRYEVEGILETGEGLSSPYIPVALLPVSPQTKEDIFAWAARGQLTYVFLDENFSRIEFESILASGDDDRDLHTSNTFGGNLTGTDDNAFNSFGYGNTGMAFSASISNLMMFRVGGTTFPFRAQGSNLMRRLQVGADVLFFNKLESDAPFEETTSDSTFLGWEADVYANWRIVSDLAVFVRYGVFFPGSAIAGDKDERHFFYTGITYSF